MTANVTVLVCGGHVNVNPYKVQAWLDSCLPLAVATALDIPFNDVRIGAIIEGNAAGADEGAGFYAIDRGIPHMQFPADWMNEGLSAGTNRNRRMFGSKYGIVASVSDEKLAQAWSDFSGMVTGDNDADNVSFVETLRYYRREP